MNALKLYWTQRRQESIATFTALVTSSIMFLIPAIWYHHPRIVILAWMLTSVGNIGHALTMVFVHYAQHKAKLKMSSNSFARLLVSLMLSLSVLRAGAADSPYTQPPPGTTAPFEFDLQLSTGIPDNQNNPQPLIPAAVCVGVGVGIIGWIGIKIWSACLDIQIRNATNKPVANFQSAGDTIPSPVNTSNPVTGSGCECQNPPTIDPLPLLLEHYDGNSWVPISVGVIPGQQSFVPDTGTWRITPMRIVATPNSMVVPPGTLEESVDLRTWSVVSVNGSVRTVTPEPNHFYRIR